MKTEFDKAMSFAYRVLAFRQRTRHELELRLEQKGFAMEISLRVLDLMVRYGYIDDKAFARLWVEQRLLKRGLPGLKRELLGKGVEPDTIDEILSEFGQDVEYGAALELAKKRVGLRGGVCPFPRLAGFLERRGFSYEVIGRVCRTLSD